jgi:hypothetical protein
MRSMNTKTCILPKRVISFNIERLTCHALNFQSPPVVILIKLIVNDNQDSGRFFWFQVDHRIIKPRMVGRNFFYFKVNEEMFLTDDRKYFERIQEITLLRYEAEEFR